MIHCLWGFLWPIINDWGITRVVYLLRVLCVLCFSSALHAQTPIYLGLDADLSAVAVEGGEAIRRGAMIAIDELNQAGGVLGRPLAPVVKDHRGNPARGMANIRAFSKMSNLVAILGGVHTPVALQEIPLLHQHQLIYLDPWAAGTHIIVNGYQPNYAFRVSICDEQAGRVLLQHAQQRQLRRLGVLLENTSWGRSSEFSISQAAQELGAQIVAVEWFNWGQTSMQQELATLREAEVDAVILVANAPEGAVVARAVLEAYPEGLPIISHWGLAGGAFVELLGLAQLRQLDLTVLQTFSFVTAYDQALSRQVLAAYRRLFDAALTPESVPSAVGVAHSYDLVHLLAKAIEQAQSIERPLVRAALEQLESHRGLVKHYQPPFTSTQHDALQAEDYIMSRFNQQGHLVPLKD